MKDSEEQELACGEVMEIVHDRLLSSHATVVENHRKLGRLFLFLALGNCSLSAIQVIILIHFDGLDATGSGFAVEPHRPGGSLETPPIFVGNVIDIGKISLFVPFELSGRFAPRYRIGFAYRNAQLIPSSIEPLLALFVAVGVVQGDCQQDVFIEFLHG